MIGTSDGQQFPDSFEFELAQLENRANSDNSNVHIIRHGSTDYNSDEKVRSWSNVPLNEDGKRESKQVAKEMANHNVDVIFHSDLDRASDTAADIAKTTGAQLVSMKDFRSWHAGDLTGKHYSEATPIMEDYAYNKPDEKLPGGESFNEFKYRVLDGLASAEQEANGRQSAIVTHRGVERLLNAWLAKGGKSNDAVDLPTFFADGEDTGSHQILPVFGPA